MLIPFYNTSSVSYAGQPDFIFDELGCPVRAG